VLAALFAGSLRTAARRWNGGVVTERRRYDLLAARSASSVSASAQPMRWISCAAKSGQLKSDDVTRSFSTR
jgi:hypothetical protein